MHRLVAYAHNGVQRFNVDRDEMVIGSDEGCDIRLAFPGVGRRHARLHSGGGRMEIEDLGSRKGLLVNGEKVRRAHLEVLDEIRLGSIALLLEDVKAEVASTAEPIETVDPESTMTPSGMLEHLALISQWVLSDSASSITLESLVDDVLDDFGGGVLFLFQGEPETRGIKFVVASEARWLGHGEELLEQVTRESEATDGALVGELEGQAAWIAFRSLSALERPYLLVVALPYFRPQEGPRGWSPAAALRTLSDQLILGLVHHVGQYEPLLFGRSAQRDLTLASGLITGESPAMKRVVSELRGAVDLADPVLLRGEVGVSKELLARSLHLSGSRAGQPFVTAACGGASPQQVEADLFGAEIAGKTGPVERVGKLIEADGGTVYLEDVDELPMHLQHRLMRFLRSGEVEPADSRSARAVDVRLIASSRRPLETDVARDHFRLDLAYRLSQYVVEVPALRDRREDLPLLIQAAVNRCCHQTGKRIQGITVKAMESLAKHDYPGNLPELEAIVRRLVYLCPSGRPIDDAMLPEEVRLSKIKGLRPDISSELNLDRLVADTERAAIREALHRAEGNKSEAARQLGLSRNGLNMKMSRLGLDA
ncbi:MAG: sigma 54-interacting transcriptional regulator [Acidobacteriota bacterium]